jgi:hypothetical protein
LIPFAKIVTKYNPIFVVSFRKRLEIVDNIKAFQHGTKEKRRK